MAFEIRYTMPIHNKDDIEFVTEFPCFLWHAVYKTNNKFYDEISTLYECVEKLSIVIGCNIWIISL